MPMTSNLLALTRSWAPNSPRHSTKTGRHNRKFVFICTFANRKCFLHSGRLIWRWQNGGAIWRPVENWPMKSIQSAWISCSRSYSPVQSSTSISTATARLSVSSEFPGKINCLSQMSWFLRTPAHMPIWFDFTSPEFFSFPDSFTDMNQTPWGPKDGNDEEKFREVSFTLTLTHPMGPKHSQVVETQVSFVYCYNKTIIGYCKRLTIKLFLKILFQVMHPDSQPGRQYIIDVEVANGGIPYADSFYVESHFYLSR